MIESKNNRKTKTEKEEEVAQRLKKLLRVELGTARPGKATTTTRGTTGTTTVTGNGRLRAGNGAPGQGTEGS